MSTVDSTVSDPLHSIAQGIASAQRMSVPDRPTALSPKGLAWFTLGLGAFEILQPRRVAEFLGVSEDFAPLIRIFGICEVAAGIGLYSGKHPPRWLQPRADGEGLDLVSLALAWSRGKKSHVGWALGSAAAATVLDVMTERTSKVVN